MIAWLSGEIHELDLIIGDDGSRAGALATFVGRSPLSSSTWKLADRCMVSGVIAATVTAPLWRNLKNSPSPVTFPPRPGISPCASLCSFSPDC